MIKKILLPLVCLISISVLAQKDTIKLKDDGILIGEIKELKQSVLSFKTSYSKKNFQIKWHEIAEIRSNRYFIVELENGTRISTTVNSIDNNPGKVDLFSGMNSFEEEIENIILLNPIGKNMFSRLSMAIDFGLTLTKANNLKQITSNISGNYTADKWSSSAYYKMVLSRQDGIDDVRRIDGNIDFLYFLPKEWFLAVEADYLGNDEQLLEMRSTYKVGGGYFFLKSNEMYFGTGTGLAYTNEKYTDGAPTKQSSEIYAGLGFNKYDIGDFSIMTNAAYYYSLTESNRNRLDLNLNLIYDLPYDFYIKMSYTYNFDSQPTEGAVKSDYVAQTSFGWELKH
ncbi:DUF481 domain-containing protein [Namhaeicola litoreus]|uniref:DUF481 domain-containing protein n=1 Tax=Namhaeicola litoreus TaxID=1052145 RepID=A0ABW3Y454_9FLAO